MSGVHRKLRIWKVNMPHPIHKILRCWKPNTRSELSGHTQQITNTPFLLFAVAPVAFAGVAPSVGGTTILAGASAPAVLMTSATPYNNHKKTLTLLKTLNPLQGCYVLGESQWTGGRLYISVNSISCGHYTHHVTGFVYGGHSKMNGFTPSVSEKLKILFTKSFEIRRPDQESTTPP